MLTHNFAYRHNGPNELEIKKMLETLGINSLDEMMEKTIPSDILRKDLNIGIGKGLSETQVIELMKNFAFKNKIFKNYIGLGYYETALPGVIQRHILENPRFYTSYTPYQAEISQGRLELLLAFQTMVAELTSMEVANASMLDEATAAAEAMTMSFNLRSRDKVKNDARVFVVDERVFPQTLAIILTRAKYLDYDVIVTDVFKYNFTDDIFGILIQYPDQYGEILDYTDVVNKAKNIDAKVVVAADIMSLALLTPPGEWGADIVIGSTQRMGLPMGFGGPHAGYMATKLDYIRQMPGRIIGVSIDANGNKALRMTLQTREQHIKRERATSNICTAQALLAMMAGAYAIYHGPDGIKEIAAHINQLTGLLAQEIQKIGYVQKNKYFFDTIRIEIPTYVDMDTLKLKLLENNINVRYINNKEIGISLGEPTTMDDVNLLLSIFAKLTGKEPTTFKFEDIKNIQIKTFDDKHKRNSIFMKQKIFKIYHSETAMMRYLTKLADRDLALDRTMIPLGSCTMKLNASTELFHLSWPGFANLHPYAPKDQVQGYLELIDELGQLLIKITGMNGITFQPNSGAAGEYTGLITIRAYYEAKGQGYRNVCLIPASAHGTNPASAVTAGMKVVVVKTDDKGNVDIEDLKTKAKENADKLAALMITYPSTHGVFEDNILEIINTIHQYGGQVYMDGANMNAQVGFTSPGLMGADVCHLNLHKTFAIPHGGGGPGAGPIAVAKHLTPYLPSHPFHPDGIITHSVNTVAAAPFGSAFILPISYIYIKMLGDDGLKAATQIAILNSNYLRKKLEPYYKILYVGSNGFCAHEFIVDCNPFRAYGITELDIAKRLMDYSFHAPTVAFPVHGTLMVEPTESEPLNELDRFVNAMISIKAEIDEVINEKIDLEKTTLKNAPHTLKKLLNDNWDLPYTREKAAVNLKDKYWPPVARIDDAYGDRNIVCNWIEDLMD
ncbi:MAG: aminomethyl-transferring glycine dehydrogenase [Bacteroidales bacterium]|jgi:glycine dehydrogenase|nr:aminomethyl-transferring glycine dehydrogenase [Bacteroidales bacterium]HOB77952.1 aminomethyl-transferring glycine dehydrogenase [Bacteroidales bacterium]HPZ61043.1 aminomethyl-transferring glycine dehydrogenase [Bacteroidales bacterium]HQD58535.1 aminomethyl-transferring glycine dehydrogenase [Bacteroidales bacterium]